jgi:hypothetical protein
VGLDLVEIRKKKDLMTAVYSNFELIGWYAFGEGVPSSEHMEIHSQMLEFNVNALFVLLKTQPKPDARHLPLSIFESEIHTVDTRTLQVFVEVPFGLESSQSERIALNKVIKSNEQDSASPFEIQNQTMSMSLVTLSHHIGEICDYLQRVQSGKEPLNLGILRKAGHIISHLPAIDSPLHGEAMEMDIAQTAALTSLASTLKLMTEVAELTEKRRVAHLSGSDALGRDYEMDMPDI